MPTTTVVFSMGATPWSYRGGSMSECHSAGSSNFIDAVTYSGAKTYRAISNDSYNIERCVMSVYTGSIPAGSIITSVKLLAVQHDGFDSWFPDALYLKNANGIPHANLDYSAHPEVYGQIYGLSDIGTLAATLYPQAAVLPNSIVIRDGDGDGYTKIGAVCGRDVNSTNPPGETIAGIGWSLSNTGLEVKYDAAPAITTEAATNVIPPMFGYSGSAQMNGVLDNDGGSLCDTYFEYGTTTSYGGVVGSFGAYTGQSIHAILPSMKRGVLYHYRAKGYNRVLDYTFYGSDVTVGNGSVFNQGGVLIAFESTAWEKTPTWTDVTADLISIHTQRGRTHELDKVEAGLATILLRNFDGNYWSENTNGIPYEGNITPLKQIAIRPYVDDDIYYIWQGHIEAWNPKWLSDRGGKIPVMEIQAVGCFKALARCSIGGTYDPLSLSGYTLHFTEADTGTRIWNVLDTANWPIEKTNLDFGLATVSDSNVQYPIDADPSSSTYGQGGVMNLNVLKYLHEVEEAEGGILFEDGFGRIAFFNRNHLVGAAASWTFSDVPADISAGKIPFTASEYSLDDTFVYNDIHVTIATASGTTANEQAVQDTDSILAYGRRTYTRTGSLLSTDDQALAQAQYLCLKYKDPILRLKSIKVMPLAGPAILFPAVWSIEIGDKCTVKLTQAGLNVDYYIENIEHDFDARIGIWTTTYQLRTQDFYNTSEAGNGNGYTSMLEASGFVYNTVHGSATAGTVINNGISMQVGQDKVSTTYHIDRGLLSINTANIAVAYTVTEATLYMYIDSAATAGGGYDISIVNGAGLSYPATAATYGDMLSHTTIYGTLPYATIDANKTGGWVSIALNAAGIAAIVKGGTTIFGLRQSWDIAGTPPTGTNLDFVVFSGSNGNSAPKLTVKLA